MSTETEEVVESVQGMFPRFCVGECTERVRRNGLTVLHRTRFECRQLLWPFY